MFLLLFREINQKRRNQVNRYVEIVGILACLLMTTGCIIPLPHVKSTCNAIEGNLVQENGVIPIPNAQVEIKYQDGGSRTTQTNQYGGFAFSEKKKLYWGILFGVALNHSIPSNDCIEYGFSTMEIHADGYDPVRILSELYWRAQDQPDLSIVELKLKPEFTVDVMRYSNVKLKKKAQ
jgi:hypothetical protein